MQSLIETLLEQVEFERLDKLGRDTGVAPQTMRDALPGVVATLVNALARYAADPRGARALHAALCRDHDGSFLADPARNEVAASGRAILGNALCTRQGDVERRLGEATGLDITAAARLLFLLAPLVLGVLGRQQRREHLDAAGLAALLRAQATILDHRAPAGLGLSSRLLDGDGLGNGRSGLRRAPALSHGCSRTTHQTEVTAVVRSELPSTSRKEVSGPWD